MQTFYFRLSGVKPCTERIEVHCTSINFCLKFVNTFESLQLEDSEFYQRLILIRKTQISKEVLVFEFPKQFGRSIIL